MAVRTLRSPRRAGRALYGRPRAVLLALALLILAALAGIGHCVAQYRAGARLYAAEAHAILAGFSRVLDAWLADACLRYTDDMLASGAARALLLTARDGSPVLPPCSVALHPPATSTLVRLLEHYLSRTAWHELPLAALTNDPAQCVITDAGLAEMMRNDRAVALAIGWHAAAAARVAGDVPRAQAIYRLLQSHYALDVDVYGFPARLAAWLEELALLPAGADRVYALEQWLEQAAALDLRDRPAVCGATLALVQRAEQLGAPAHALQRVRTLLGAFLPATGAYVRAEGIRDGRRVRARMWLDDTRGAAWMAEHWQPVIAARASNSFVHLAVRAPGDPPALGERVCTNLYGATLGLVPFDAARWVARHRARMLAQVAGLSCLVLVLAWLALRTLRLVRAERQLQADQLNFVAAVSHELRTPIAAVRALAESIARGVVPAAGGHEQYARLIMSESDRLTQLVNNILDVARAPSAGTARALRPVRLDQAAETAVAAFTLPAAAKRVAITAHILTAPLINGTPQALERIACNLVDNAVKYSREGGAVIVTVAADAAQAWLSVQDFGIGIARAEHERIFARFYRVGGELTRAYPGAGLGLAIVRELAGALGAHVTVASAPGTGSTFTVTFPRISESCTQPS